MLRQATVYASKLFDSLIFFEKLSYLSAGDKFFKHVKLPSKSDK